MCGSGRSAGSAKSAFPPGATTVTWHSAGSGAATRASAVGGINP